MFHFEISHNRIEFALIKTYPLLVYLFLTPIFNNFCPFWTVFHGKIMLKLLLSLDLSEPCSLHMIQIWLSNRNIQFYMVFINPLKLRKLSAEPELTED